MQSESEKIKQSRARDMETRSIKKQSCQVTHHRTGGRNKKSTSRVLLNSTEK